MTGAKVEVEGCSVGVEGAVVVGEFEEPPPDRGATHPQRRVGGGKLADREVVGQADLRALQLAVDVPGATHQGGIRGNGGTRRRGYGLGSVTFAAALCPVDGDVEARRARVSAAGRRDAERGAPRGVGRVQVGTVALELAVEDD
ncbi:hypothetical protein PG985_003426 [Apiospora marii]|uniref:uncharacterized protein n=1 Tax=Apiospora marii TaxID=335849 RepID=UPI0031317D31